MMLFAIMVMVLPFLVYLCLNLITVQITKLTYGKAMPITMMSVPLFLIVSHAVFHTFWVAVYLLIGISVIAFIQVAYLLIRKDNTERINNIFSAGFFGFIALWIFVIALDKGRLFNFFDEFAHWGMMVKTMFRLDDYYTVTASNLIIHKDYPPFSSLVNLFWVMVSHGFSEKGCIMASHLYELSLMVLPVVEICNIKKKALSGSVVTIVLSALLVIIFAGTNSYFSSIYADIPLMATVAFAMILAIDEELFDDLSLQICFILSGVAIMLMKQIGMALVLIPVSLLVWRIVTGKQYKGRKLFLSIKALVSIIPGAVSSIVWNAYVDSYNISKEFDMERADFGSAFHDIIHNLGGQYDRGFDELMDAVLTKNILGLKFGVSYLGAYLIIVALLLVLFLVLRKKKSGMDALGMIFSISCGTFGYLVIMILTFVFFIVGRDLSGYKRYVSTFVTMEFIVVFLQFMKIIMKKDSVLVRSIGIVFPAVLLLCVVKPERIYKITPMSFEKESKFDNWRKIGSRIDEVLPDGTSFYLLNDPKEDMKYVVHYINDTNRLNIGFCDYTFSASPEDTDIVNGIMQSIGSVEYLYVKDVPENLKDLFVVSDGKPISSDELYAVKKTDEGLVLERQ